ncbi:MAG: ROK family glucokinase [Lachnospiraceae bacterium]|jgi:glucokinase|nr:ROK family glucokinase [Lachnospiraceae bacterium]MCI9600386.1 ROK family glucokinase [Lachnospiraceae bacterium]MDE7319404.1 ROK family glucokinase [Lachnospiraceae bacterium]
MKNYCFGIDVGGTTVKMGLFQTDGQLVEKWEIPTRTEEGGKAILPDIAAYAMAKLVEKDISREDVAGIGIGVPGPIDADGVVPHTANLGWGYKEVTKELSELTGVTCKGGNDANVAALGEMWKGAAAGHRSGVMVTLGTGVGGGIIIDGRIVVGTNGAGGEIGHIHVDDSIPWLCGCGNQGCLEQVASANGIVRLAKWMQETEAKETVLDLETMTAKEVWDAVKDGDAFACEVAERFGKYLGLALANIASTVDPEVFVIGGGVSKAGPVILDYIKKYYLKYTFKGCRDAEFVLATLGNDAGIYGSAKLVIEE